MKNADELFKKIPKGHANAMYVPNSNIHFRDLVREANLSGTDVIINIRGGYFRVNENDDEDMALFDEYVERERLRARTMWIKANAMKRTMERRTNGKNDNTN